jgi:hypothetical protein
VTSNTGSDDACVTTAMRAANFYHHARSFPL